MNDESDLMERLGKPELCRIIPVTEYFIDYARHIAFALEEKGIRVEIDDKVGKNFGHKLRDARDNKIWFIAVVGQRELNANCMNVRHLHRGDLGLMSIVELISELTK